jgi:hydroxymethylbilane synthase
VNITLRLGSRRSALAKVQAKQVGDALLDLDPALRIAYRFIESSGDRSAEPNAGLITARGGFTEDLGQMLDDGTIDLAVHSWKDLPLARRSRSTVVATLPRADARDVLLLRRDSLAMGAVKGLTILSSSARRRHHLEDFLEWALPIKPPAVNFAPVRGDIATRLSKLLRGDGDALVIAKAALDRLIETRPEQLATTGMESVAQLCAAQEIVRRALEACRVMVLPLQYCPAAPAQGALAIEVPNNTRFQSLWSKINHESSFELVTLERQFAEEIGEHVPLGLTRLRFAFGDVQFMRGDTLDDPAQRLRLYRHGQALPRPTSEASIWCANGDAGRVAIRCGLPGGPRRFGAATGLLVARADALPAGVSVADTTIIWTPGLATWRKLAARGFWVVGSDESLGETGAMAIRRWFPATQRWLKLTHETGFQQENSEFVPAYRRQRAGPLADIGSCTHFFWRSGSQLRDYLSAYPRLAQAWHGCGPGNTWRIARELLDPQRLAPYLSAEQFRAELLS